MLALIEHEVGLGTEAERHFVVGRPNAYMEVARSEFLFIAGQGRQQVEVAQSEAAGYIQIYFIKGVQIVDGCTGAVVEGIPFSVFVGQVETSVHAIHTEIQV